MPHIPRSAVRQAASARRRARVLSAAVIVCLFVAACQSQSDPASGGATGGDDARDGTFDPRAEMRTDLLVAEPSKPATGEIVGLRFPEETSRGVLYVLERKQGDGWAHVYSMLSDHLHPPKTVPAEHQLDWEDVEVGGPGPDRVKIPEDAEAGEYRVCTGNRGENFCTPIEIVPPE